MNTVFNKFFCTLLVAGALASCKKDETKLTYTDASFPANALTASQTNFELSKQNDSTEVVTFAWKKTDFGFKGTMAYYLEFDVPSDTAGGWEKAKTVDAADFEKSYLGVDLNSMANALGLPPGSTSQMLVRVKAVSPQYNGAASNIKPAYTNTIVLNVNPYALYLFVPGDYQTPDQWSPATAPKIVPFSAELGYVFEGYVYMPGGGHGFKFTNAPDWDHVNYGDAGGGKLSTDGLAGGLSVPSGGYYELIANLKDMTWKAIKTDWGIIGDARVGGDWNTDTDMTYDPVSQTWSATLDMKTSGSFKFRANDGWSIDFGLNKQGKLVYSDNTIVYNGNTDNLSVSFDGNYTITLDLHVPGNYTYTLKKN